MTFSFFRTLFFGAALAGLAACGGPDDAQIASEADELARRPDLIECRSDRACPRGSYCEPGLHACFTSSRCYVNGRPSDRFCERTYGEGFVCFEYAPGSHHCVPTE